MICFPNAKINLGLNVVEKRSDGFHTIETLFYPIGLCDVLEVVEKRSGNKEIDFTTTGIKVDGPAADNICLKAFNLLKNQHDLPPVKIHLHKAIPVGAGLGGGSSDGAWLIKLINNMFSLSLPVEKMQQLAAQLGSDCAFFINNKPAIAGGRGEILKEAAFNLKNSFLVLIMPKIAVSTAQAYSHINPKVWDINIQTLLKDGKEVWSKSLMNDFEVPVFNLYPEIKSIKEMLHRSGAYYAAMSGSGSSVFGLFDSEPGLEIFKAHPYFVWKEKLN